MASHFVSHVVRWGCGSVNNLSRRVAIPHDTTHLTPNAALPQAAICRPPVHTPPSPPYTRGPTALHRRRRGRKPNVHFNNIHMHPVGRHHHRGPWLSCLVSYALTVRKQSPPLRHRPLSNLMSQPVGLSYIFPNGAWLARLGDLDSVDL